MTKFRFLILTLIISLASCTKEIVVKNYKYFVTFEKQGLFGGINYEDNEAENISATSDSIAYCIAYKKFCIARKVYFEANMEYPVNVGTPVKFKLVNELGNDIVDSVNFNDKTIIELKIEEKIQGMPSTIKKK